MKKAFTLIELLIVVAIIAILAAIAVPNFLEAQVRSKVSRVKTDQRSLATALESYYIDNNSYPAVDSSKWSGTNGFGVNAGLTNASALLLNMPTFRMKQHAGDRLMTITTPVSYITSIFIDPFAKSSGASFAYSIPNETLGTQATGWLLWSYGPDVDETIANAQSPSTGGDIVVANAGAVNPRVAETFYNPLLAVPSASLTDIGTYDPTNGTTSSGDVWRAKQ
jgi:prepilin-type N-terminal cleavage/methylation domain-containing protein